MKLKSLLCTIIALVIVLSSFTAFALDRSDGSIPYWDDAICCKSESERTTAAEPTLNLTFSDDGTKLEKIEFSGCYTNAGSAGSAAVWYGAGFGIDETKTKYTYVYVFKNHSSVSGTKSDPNQFDDVYPIYYFTSSNCYDYNSSFNAINLGHNSEIAKTIAFSYDLTAADQAKLDPNKTYYVNIIFQGWGGSTALWGTITGKSFKLSDCEDFRYSVDFDYQGHGGTNFTMAVEKDDTVDTTDARLTPTEEGYTFGGWFTDAACTKPVDFTTKITQNAKAYAKWTKNPYKVTFDLQGHDTNFTQSVNDGNTVDTTDARLTPTASGYTFGGWFMDQDCVFEADFTQPETADAKYFALWIKKPSPETGDNTPVAALICAMLMSLGAIIAIKRKRA